MAERTVWRAAAKNLPKPQEIAPRRPGAPMAFGSSSIYDPSKARNPQSTQSEAPPHSPGFNKARQLGQANVWEFDNRRILNDTGNNMGSFSSVTKNPASGRILQTSGSTQSNRTDMTINALRKDERIYTREDYRVGVIFSTAHHVQDQELGTLSVDSIRTESNAGRIISKYRKFIVVADYHYHCVAIPLFTHEGKGLAAKPSILLQEFVSVRDKNANALTKGDTMHGVLWTRSKGNESGFASTSRLSNAQLSHPFSHSYNKPCAMHTKLDNESIEKLMKLYIDCIDRGLDTMFKKLGIDDGSQKVIDPRDPSNYMPSTPKAPKTITKKAEEVLESWDM